MNVALPRGKVRPLIVLCLLVAALVTLGSRTAHATFPGPNGKILFVSFETGNADIYTINPDGSGLTNVTANDPTSNVTGAWSPDGTRIAFSSRRDGNSEIYVMNGDGSNQTRLTTNPGFDSFPSWSPDGTHIVFTSSRDGAFQKLYLMNADGSNAQRLTTGTAGHLNPRFAPDGLRIVFGQVDGPVGDQHSSLWTIHVDGTHFEEIAPGMDGGAPDWGPYGNRIVFANNVCNTCEASDLFVVKANGKDVRQVTRNFGNNMSPSWSPDGTRFVFMHEATVADPPYLYTINADGGSAQVLTTIIALSPSWGSAPVSG